MRDIAAASSNQMDRKMPTRARKMRSYRAVVAGKPPQVVQLQRQVCAPAHEVVGERERPARPPPDDRPRHWLWSDVCTVLLMRVLVWGARNRAVLGDRHVARVLSQTYGVDHIMCRFSSNHQSQVGPSKTRWIGLEG